MELELKLGELFDEGFKGLESILNCKEATNSSEVQVRVRRAISTLEDCTRLVSASGMFSTNESIEEVSSINIRYLLLPALLGRLTLQLATDANGRLEVVLVADTYFKDFLRRCRDYGVVDNDEITSLLDEEPETPDGASSPKVGNVKSTTTDLQDMANKRSAKIRKHQAQKELEKRLEDLKMTATREGADDEIIREYHTALLNINVSQAVDELGSLGMEKNILMHMTRLKRDTRDMEEYVPEEQRPPSRRPKHKPLAPVIITKDEVMKKVYGAGYPSLPVMTVAEFYEQRVKEGIFPGGSSSQHSHGEGANAMPLSDETETEHQERQEEEDDPVLLARRRAMDEFKDEHRRGEGNRYNRS